MRKFIAMSVNFEYSHTWFTLYFWKAIWSLALTHRINYRLQHVRITIVVMYSSWHGPLTRYVKLRECRERFPRHRLQRNPLVSDTGTHHGTCATQVPWWMSGSLTRGSGENVPGILGACTTRNFTYLTRDPLVIMSLVYIAFVIIFKHS